MYLYVGGRERDGWVVRYCLLLVIFYAWLVFVPGVAG